MNDSHSAHAPEDRYFEDYIPGTVHEFGSIGVDEDEVFAFGGATCRSPMASTKNPRRTVSRAA